VSAYRIREVDGDDEVEALTSLHLRTFDPTVPHGDYDDGFWWLAYFEDEPIAFAGVCESDADQDIGYFSRVGVLKQHRGNQLQRRLMRALETKSRKVGWQQIVTDTTNTDHSANNIVAAGYRLYTPRHPWAFSNTLYWKKDLAR
jgi:GNAT superfamily N-acetyltransferase